MDVNSSSTESGAPTIAEQRHFYNERWEQREFANRLQLERTTEILRAVQSLDLRRPRILELGCGTGWLTSILGEFGPAVGVDLSTAAITKAATRYSHVEFRAIDLSAPIKLGTFDVVVSHEVLEHLEDQAHHLELAAGSLNPGGHLILTTPNGGAGLFRAKPPIEGAQPIENWLTRRRLHDLLSARFTVLRCEPFGWAHADRGIAAALTAPQAKRLARRFGVFGLYAAFIKALGIGRHLVAVGRRQ